VVSEPLVPHGIERPCPSFDYIGIVRRHPNGGETGLSIIEAIIGGERDPEQLAALCSSRIKASRQTVAESLHGNWDQALLFALEVALETYRFAQAKIQPASRII
jgi:transposase